MANGCGLVTTRQNKVLQRRQVRVEFVEGGLQPIDIAVNDRRVAGDAELAAQFEEMGVKESLESAGFIRRTPSKEDRRSVVLRATPSGKRALGRLLGAFEELDARVNEVLSEDEQEALTTGLLRLLEVLQGPREQGGA